MTTPNHLQAGDHVGIVAPGRKVKPEDVEVAGKTFSAWGFNVVYGDNLFSDEHSYLSASDQHRLADLQKMLDDPAIKAIFCARGGYGTTRILDQLDFSKFEDSPKWIVGFSDITALHLKLYNKGFASLHATMPILFSQNDSQDSVQALRKVLFGETTTLRAIGNARNKAGDAVGKIVGGNLSLVVDSLATSNEVDTAENILLIEEIEEYRYKIDRMLTQLKRAGKLESLSGLIVGHFTAINDSTLAFGESVEDMILHHTKDYSFPIAFNFPSGHENPNLPWIHGAVMKLSVSPQQTILEQL